MQIFIEPDCERGGFANQGNDVISTNEEKLFYKKSCFIEKNKHYLESQT